jgi:hypothetical protein
MSLSKTKAGIASVATTTAMAALAAAAAINMRAYGWTLFVVVPFFIGFFPAVILRLHGPRSFADCLRWASVVPLVLAMGFLLLGKEGIICMLLALPLAALPIAFGSYVAYLLMHRSALLSPGTSAVIVVLGLAASLTAEARPRNAPTYTASDVVDVGAPPPVVWNALLHMGDLGQPPDLLFRLGVACPQRVDIYGTGVGADRVCTLTTGQLHERIIAWQPNQRLAWQSVSTPPPLKELNPFRETAPPHLHGFYRSVAGQFVLVPLGRDSTRVTRYSSYQHNMYPAAYWRLWCDYVAHRGHVYVLGILKSTAESESRIASVSHGP